MSTARTRRKKRIRSKIVGTKEKPRLSLFRSSKHIYAQLIDDTKKSTLASVTDVKKISVKGTKTERARHSGILLAKLAIEKKIKQAVFDRNGYKFHGRVKAFAEGVREGGLKI